MSGTNKIKIMTYAKYMAAPPNFLDGQVIYIKDRDYYFSDRQPTANLSYRALVKDDTYELYQYNEDVAGKIDIFSDTDLVELIDKNSTKRGFYITNKSNIDSTAGLLYFYNGSAFSSVGGGTGVPGPKGDKGDKGDQGDQGDQVFVRYSAYPDGTNFTESWNNSQAYMGVAIGQTAPSSNSGYTWSKFIGTYVQLNEDSATTNITHNLTDNSDKTYKANGITRVEIVVPSEMYHGFYAGINFKSGSSAPQVVFTNNSALPLKIMQFGMVVASHTPRPNTVTTMSILCDGINIYCYLNEV